MENQCPHCGKNNRPGAQFCGFCGQDMSKGKPPAPQAGSAPPLAAPAAPSPPQGVAAGRGGGTCPHCGQPARAGMKFCASCGKAIAAPVAPPAQPPAPPKPPLPTPTPPPPQPAPRRARLFPRLRQQLAQAPLWMKLLVVLGAVVICITLALIFWSFGFAPKATPTPALIETEEVAVVDVPAETETPKPTRELQVELPTLTPLPPSPTEQPTEAPPPTATEEIAAPADTVPPQLSFEDQFRGGLEERWEVWGEPLPMIGPEEFLELSGENSAQAGASLKEVISLNSGMVIEFRAKMRDDAPGRSLYLDWAPGPDVRPPTELGPLHLEITIGQLSLSHRQFTCHVSLENTHFVHYRIDIVEVGEGWIINLYVDEQLQGACSDVAVQPPPEVTGRFTLSGNGRVDWFRISTP